MCGRGERSQPAGRGGRRSWARGSEDGRTRGGREGGTVQTCRVGPPEAPSASQSDETRMNGAATSTTLVCATVSARVPQAEVRGPLGDPARHCRRQNGRKVRRRNGGKKGFEMHSKFEPRTSQNTKKKTNKKTKLFSSPISC